MTDWWHGACLAAACVQLLHSAGLEMRATSWELMHTGRQAAQLQSAAWEASQ